MKTTASSSPRLPQRVSLVTQTAQSLRESMLAGHWHGHLPGERELCARLQVSRHTLRAALQMLQREGSLEVADRQRRRIKSAVKTRKTVLERDRTHLPAPAAGDVPVHRGDGG